MEKLILRSFSLCFHCEIFQKLACQKNIVKLALSPIFWLNLGTQKLDFVPIPPLGSIFTMTSEAAPMTSEAVPMISEANGLAAGPATAPPSKKKFFFSLKKFFFR